MDPRDPIRSALKHLGPCPVLLAAFLLFLALSVPGAYGAIQSITIEPEFKTSCDPVSIRVAGMLPSCTRFQGSTISEPESIPEWMGPIPAYRTRINLTAEREIPPGGCVELGMDVYNVPFELGSLPAGHHVVIVTERIFDDGVLVDSTRADTTFAVLPDSCNASSCVLLGASPISAYRYRCDATAPPGGHACFDIHLLNRDHVSGIQVRLRITDTAGNPLPSGSFTPMSVIKTPRSEPLSLEWQPDGAGVSAMLFTTSGATIAPGAGSVLQVCYQVGPEVEPGVYRITWEQRLIADHQGNELPMCPTLVELSDNICVTGDPGCDVNGDGSADLRDIVRLVRCSLAGPSCPDEIEDRSDCNADQHVDVRDVICCVRRLLQAGPLAVMPADNPPGGVWNRIGFTGPATWASPLSGRAVIALEPSSDFGAMGLDLVAPMGLRITGVEVIQGSGLEVTWHRRDDGYVRAILLRTGSDPVGDAKLAVHFEQVGAIAAGGAIRLGEIQDATWDGAAALVERTNDAAAVTAAALTAPALAAARPNPFRGTTEIPFALPARGRVSVRVYDVAGRLVRTLLDGERDAGAHRVTWDGRDARGRSAPVGIYFVKLSAMGAERTARLIRMR